MGISWGVEFVRDDYVQSFPNYMPGWRSICAADICGSFSIPVGETLHRFARQADGSPQVDTLFAPNVIRAIQSLECDDAVQLSCLDGYEVFFPDARGHRDIDVDGFRYRRGHDLELLLKLEGSGIEQQLRAAAALAKQHQLIVAVDY